MFFVFCLSAAATLLAIRLPQINNAPPVVIHDIKPRRTVITPLDRRFLYDVRYDRRDCKVTRGSYGVAGVSARGEHISVPRFQDRDYGTWPAGRGMTAKNVGVLIPNLVPRGQYETWWRYCYDCPGATRELCVTSPKMPFSVVD